MVEEDDIMISTPYGPTTLATAETWPTLVCPVCHRQHAHPPDVRATYWPVCWECWEKETSP